MDVSTDQISGDQGQMLGAIKVSKPLLDLQIVCFAILNAIWVLPGTISLRNICLITKCLQIILHSLNCYFIIIELMKFFNSVQITIYSVLPKSRRLSWRFPVLYKII